MSKSYKVLKTVVHMGPKNGKTLYSVRPYSYGTLTTDEVAKQISMESTATPADVKAVLDRYAYYVKENLKKGYDIELLGFGKLYLRFITSGAVEDEKNANAKLVKSLIPSFRPAYSLLKNGSRVYNLVPDNIELVNYDDEKKSKTPGDADGGGSAGENKNRARTITPRAQAVLVLRAELAALTRVAIPIRVARAQAATSTLLSNRKNHNCL